MIILDAIQWVSAAVQSVKHATVTNFFKKISIVNSGQNGDIVDDENEDREINDFGWLVGLGLTAL